MSDYDEYLAARTKLIAEERSIRCDTTYLKNASKEELQAEQIIREIRAEEAESIWSVDHEGITNTFPGMQFLSGEYTQVNFTTSNSSNFCPAKKLVMQSKIFQILQKVLLFRTRI